MVRTLVVSVRGICLLALLCAVGASVGGLGLPPTMTRASGGTSNTVGPALLERVLDSLRSCWRLTVELAQAHPSIAGLTAAVLGLWLLVRLARNGLSVAATKDPRRAYSSDERKAGFGRAGGRCEFDAWLGLSRCGRAAEHGDHWWPHSRGGATSMPNLVAGCAWHNRSKGATLPTRGQTRRITRRRRRYFPEGIPLVPGERYQVRR